VTIRSDPVRTLSIAGRAVGPGAPVYVVAELSGNHNGDFERALAILRAASDAGADAVKLQTYTPDTLTIACDNPHFRIGAGTAWQGRTLHDLYAEASTPWEWHEPLARAAQDLSLDLFSSPFDNTAVAFLEQLGMPAYKIASFELVDLALIRRAARTGKPLIMSTGMASEVEIGEAIGAARDGGAVSIALLKCTSAYPSPPEQMNLRTIPHLAAAFNVPVGLSDHSLNAAVPVAAVALGACIVEKHLTLRRADGGPDAGFSLEPAEFRQTVRAVRLAERALGEIRYGPSDAERASRVFRRSLFIVRDVRAGQTLTAEDVRAIRPGYGLAPKHLDRVLGRAAVADIERGTPLEWSHVGLAPAADAVAGA
jgi:N-acetylneuraminate synthase